jgi:hypothetical protein
MAGIRKSQILPRLFDVAASSRWPLAVVVLVEAVLFTGYFQERWSKSLVPLGRPRALLGEGLVIRSDGLGYYAWLRSLLLDGDWDFDNEFDAHNVIGDYVPPAAERTELGRRANPWSIGPACVWSVVVAPAHGLLRILPSPWPADGYSLPYQLLVGMTTLLVSFAGLGFLYGICRHFTDPGVSALTAALVTLGTSLVYYNTLEGSMAHGVATTAVAGLVWYWLRTFGSPRPGRWLLLGVLLGFVAVMRWQLAALAVLPVGEALLQRQWRPAVGLLGAVAGFFPQMLAWKCVYGHWLIAPLSVAHNWLQPAWDQVLFTQNRGLFYWTPLTLLAVVGCVRAARTPAIGLLLAAFLVQVYVLASVSGTGVYLGVAFGFRQLTEALVLLAPGLAMLLAASRRTRLLVGGVGCLLVLWNLFLLCQYRYGWIPANAGADPATLLANAARLVVRKRWLLVGQVVAAPALLGLWLYWNRSGKSVVIPSTPQSHRRLPSAGSLTVQGTTRMPAA